MTCVIGALAAQVLVFTEVKHFICVALRFGLRMLLLAREFLGRRLEAIFDWVFRVKVLHANRALRGIGQDLKTVHAPWLVLLEHFLVVRVI